MAPFGWLVNGFATLIVVACVGRASLRLVRDPEEDPETLVSVRERRATTAVGIPLALVGASTLAGGPLVVPYDPVPLLVAGVVLVVYPDFTPGPGT